MKLFFGWSNSVPSNFRKVTSSLSFCASPYSSPSYLQAVSPATIQPELEAEGPAVKPCRHTRKEGRKEGRKKPSISERIKRPMPTTFKHLPDSMLALHAFWNAEQQAIQQHSLAKMCSMPVLCVHTHTTTTCQQTGTHRCSRVGKIHIFISALLSGKLRDTYCYQIILQSVEERWGAGYAQRQGAITPITT
eukprot:scaffold38137_cov21-Tisochrysis_lutea.AAC.2